jgi:hypothetical protein
MMASDPLPNEDQRKALCDLMRWAFVELRLLDGGQAHDLADAFHNSPHEMYGRGRWSVAATRAQLQHYQTKHAANKGFNYVAAFDAIFGPPVSHG